MKDKVLIAVLVVLLGGLVLWRMDVGSKIADFARNSSSTTTDSSEDGKMVLAPVAIRATM